MGNNTSKCKEGKKEECFNLPRKKKRYVEPTGEYLLQSMRSTWYVFVRAIRYGRGNTDGRDLTRDMGHGGDGWHLGGHRRTKWIESARMASTGPIEPPVRQADAALKMGEGCIRLDGFWCRGGADLAVGGR